MGIFHAMYRTGATVAIVLSFLLAGCSGSANSGAVPVAAGCGGTQGPIPLKAFGDASHLHPQCQFNLGDGAVAYVYAQDVSPADHYIVYVQSSGSNHSCVFTSPQSQGATNVCSPPFAHNDGIQAPGGSLSVSWPFGASLQAGQYWVNLFDRDADEGRGAVIGRVQLSISPG